MRSRGSSQSRKIGQVSKWGIGAIRNYDKRGMILASKYRPVSKLENFDFEIGSTGSEIVSPRSFVAASFAMRTRASGRDRKCAVAHVIRVLYIHTIRTSSIPWYNGSLDYRPWIYLEAVETILDGISESHEIMNSVICIIVIIIFIMLLIYKF